MTTNSAKVNVINSIEDRFEVLEAGLVYVDAPLEGFVRERGTARLYAFRVTVMVEDRVWHWVLVPAEGERSTVSETFTVATQSGSVRWTSIIEDRRGIPSMVSMVTFDEGVALPRSVRDG